MKFLCDSCGQMSGSGDVRVEAGQVAVVCQHCGTANPLAGSGTAPDASASLAPVDGPEPAPQDAKPEPAPTALEAAQADSGSAAAAAASLPPVKCPKCFHRQLRSDYCGQCGLDLNLPGLDKSRWEPDPSGREQDYAEALNRWARIEADPPNRTHHDGFVDHCTQHALLDLCTRRYREYCADHPGSEPATHYLLMAVERMEKVAVAMLQGETWADDLKRRVTGVKRVMLALAVILLLLGMMLLALVWKQRGSLLPPDL